MSKSQPPISSDVSSRAEKKETLLEIRNLKKYFDNEQSLVNKLLNNTTEPVKAVDGVSFDIIHGETLGLVGESGCGKSTVGKTILRLHEATGGKVVFDNKNIFEMNRKELKQYRRQSQLVFQEPFDSINPRMTIRDCLSEPLRVHDIGTKSERDERIKQLLEDVGLSADYVDRYVHEFSGGQCQRIAIARALAVQPDLIVLDEPVSALDVSVQAQILNLLSDIQDEFNITFLFISHNLSAIQHICDRVAVMYLGQVCELASVETIFSNPSHPYTEALLENISRADPDDRHREREMLTGDVPSPRNPPSGCRFRTRCPKIIPPEDMTVDQKNWRGIMFFKQKLNSDTINLNQVERMYNLDSYDTQWTDLNRDKQVEILKEHYDLPLTVEDVRLQEVLTTTCRYVCDERYGEARQLLSEAFVSICEIEKPEEIELKPGHTVHCHLQ